MGCGASIPVHPAIYNETIAKQQHKNGVLKTPKPPRETNPKHITGDYSQYQVAKHTREKNQKNRQIKVFMEADEMSGRLLEEREMLSLGTRSRGTSRNTSRGASPTGTKRNQETVIPLTPVNEDKFSRGTSKSETTLPHNEPIPKKKKRPHKNSKSKGKGKSKKHRKGKKSKHSKDKSLKDIEETDDEDLDSGVEDEDDEGDNDVESDKENEIINTVKKANTLQKEGGPKDKAYVERQSDVDDSGLGNNTQNDESPTVSTKRRKSVKFVSKDSGIVLNSSSDRMKGDTPVIRSET